jgi:hypothetical protein
MYDDVFVLPPTGLLMPPVEADTEELKKVELTGGFGRCNDGSNPVYFLGYGTEATKWVLFFEVRLRPYGATNTCETASEGCMLGQAFCLFFPVARM